ncbi:MAG: Zn-ribbon domain-containing OB-fold protein [Candidatus Thermoplasmatota archaeon]|nr:Zn-ribbon domain-containing OB-fold protein [Candidatus Thermoplasmatota archaeon]
MPVPRFWRETQRRYNIVGNECTVCNTKYFPPRIVCPKCHRASIGKMKDFKFSGEGEILTYTVVHNGIDAFEYQVPYVMAIIELKEGARVTGQIVDVEIENVKIGMKVESTFRKIGEDGKSGMIYYGYKFKPVKQ